MTRPVTESGTDVDCNEPQSPILRSDLANWALRNNITHKAINELLKIFLSYMPKCLLPKDARALLHTPRPTNCTEVQGGGVFTLWCRTNFKFLC